MELSELLDKVNDAPSFLAFARALSEDRLASIKEESIRPSSPYGPEALGWENITIEAFLNCAISWAEASNFGLSQGISPDNHWKQFAVFLYCGKIYE